MTVVSLIARGTPLALTWCGAWGLVLKRPLLIGKLSFHVPLTKSLAGVNSMGVRQTCQIDGPIALQSSTDECIARLVCDELCFNI